MSAVNRRTTEERESLWRFLGELESHNLGFTVDGDDVTLVGHDVTVKRRFIHENFDAALRLVLALLGPERVYRAEQGVEYDQSGIHISQKPS